MLKWLKQLDSILRGEATRLAALRQGIIDISVRGLSSVLVSLGVLYGLCMAVFSLIDSKGLRWQQLIASAVKVPLLFFLTLAVTFPSLYVFNALVGSRLSIVSVLRLLVAAMGVMLSVLAAFGTIVAFFSISSTSYAFMLLLNVAFFAVAGFLGLAFLLRTLHRLTIVQEQPEQPAADIGETPVQVVKLPPPLPSAEMPAGNLAMQDVQLAEEPMPVQAPGALDRTEGQVVQRQVKMVFGVWVCVFALVGAQMSWILRPFIGSPNMPFAWFRPRESNFFEAVWNTLRHLVS